MNLSFKNSSNNCPVCESITDNWIEEGIQFLKDNIEARYYYSSSGDSIIIIFRLHELDGGGFEIIRTNKFDLAYYDNDIFSDAK